MCPTLSLTRTATASLPTKRPRNDGGRDPNKRQRVGAKGDRGIAGKRGEKGTRGERGDRGEGGLQGVQGPAGVVDLDALKLQWGMNKSNGVDKEQLKMHLQDRQRSVQMAHDFALQMATNGDRTVATVVAALSGMNSSKPDAHQPTPSSTVLGTAPRSADAILRALDQDLSVHAIVAAGMTDKEIDEEVLKGLALGARLKVKRAISETRVPVV